LNGGSAVNTCVSRQVIVPVNKSGIYIRLLTQKEKWEIEYPTFSLFWKALATFVPIYGAFDAQGELFTAHSSLRVLCEGLRNSGLKIWASDP
jgi:hypothetical protein